MNTEHVPSYDSYRDSQVEWLGDVPSSWRTKRLKFVVRILKRIVGREGPDVLSITQQGIKIKDVESGEGQLAMNYSNYQIVHNGDFAMNHMDLITGYVDISSYEGVTSPDYRVFRNVSPDIRDGYLLLLFQSCYRSKVFFRYGQGVSFLGRWRFPTESFNNFAIPIPSLSEQDAIVNYVGEKTAKIDDAVAIEQRQIALLKERKQIVIQNAVTKGLNPNAPMKDSGVDWIGKIPAHWLVENGKWLFRHRNQRARAGEPQLAATQKYGVIPQSEFMDMEGRRVVQVFLDFSILKHVEAGDFVISMRSFQGGLEYSDYTGCVSSAYVALKPGPKVNVKYFKHLFKSGRYIEALQSTSNLVRDGQALRFENFAMVLLPVAPWHEQEAIAEYIDNVCVKIDGAIALIEKKISALKEYKSTLINSAVTGKIKVA